MKYYHKVLQAASVIAASYGASALIGILCAAFTSVVGITLLNWDASASLQFMSGLIFIGPAIGCLLTFFSRKILDITFELDPDLKNGISGSGSDESSSPNVTIAILALAAIALPLLFLSYVQGRGAAEPTDRCILSRMC